MNHTFPPLFKKLLLQEKQRRESMVRSYCWDLNARPEQRIPQGNWRVWLILAGRGFGKTRTGAETVRAWAESGAYRRICLLGHTFSDVLHVMLKGASGLLSVCPEWNFPRFIPSQRRLVWPNGAEALMVSASNPDQLRGLQFDAAWVDELAKFPHPQEVWDQLMMTLRLGEQPRALVTTTPQPLPLLWSLLEREDVFVTRGSTLNNKANLPPDYIKHLQDRYGHTRWGLQEIDGQLFSHGGPKNLWTCDMIDAAQYRGHVPPLQRVVVAVDPAVSQGNNSDETGLVAAGIDEEGFIYVLWDGSGRLSPTQWAKEAVEAYHRYKADRLVAEVNNGGDLVERVVRTVDASVAYRAVWASRGKCVRAEPIVALYEQRRVRHVGNLGSLEQQLLSYGSDTSEGSPDRMDALVWALTDLVMTPKVAHKGGSVPRLWSYNLRKPEIM